MKSGKSIDNWFPFYIDKWLFGSTRHELRVKTDDGVKDLRGIWIDILAFSRKDDGWIRANENTPYPIEQLSGIFDVQRDDLILCIKLAKEHGKIDEPKPGIYYVTSTNTYILSDRHKRRIESMSENMDAMSTKAVVLSSPLLSSFFLNILNYYNENRGKMRRCNEINEKREVWLSARRRKKNWTEDFKKAIIKARTLGFFTGNNDRGWYGTIDFFIRNSNNVTRVLEGEFDGKGKSHEVHIT